MVTELELNDTDSVKKNWTKVPSRKTKNTSYPVLPIKGETNVLITSALPYVNNIPHLGNIIGCVLSGDCYARYCRLRGYQTLYVCGTDEYGTATETKALQENTTPQAICDKYYQEHKQIYEWFNIQFDIFGRTTTEHQTRIAHDIFLKLYENDCIVQDQVQQLFCEACERSLADRFVEGICPRCGYPDARGDQCDACGKLINPIELKNPVCKICRKSPVEKSTVHLFLDLPKLQCKLEEWIAKSQSNGKWSKNAISITKAWINEGLNQRCITRDLKWGTKVPLPEFSDKVFYVWFDAPIGYISITACYTDQWEKWWKNPQDVKLVNFMAKDNVPFHTVIFPCSLLGTGDDYSLLNDISSTEYLNYEDDKFSKSRGIGVFGDNAKDSGISADTFRFYLLSNRPETQDTCFSWDDLVTRNNGDVVNNLGNFVYRTLKMLFNFNKGRIDEIDLENCDILKFIKSVDSCLNQYIKNMEKCKMKDALSNVLEISRFGNSFIQSNEPWLLAEAIEKKSLLSSVLSVSTQAVCLIGVLLQPFMPSVSSKLLNELSINEHDFLIPINFIPLLPTGTIIKQPSILFEKLDKSIVDDLRSKYSGQKSNVDDPDSIIISNFAKSFKDEISNIEKSIISEHIQKQNTLIESLRVNGAPKHKLLPELGKLEALKHALNDN